MVLGMKNFNILGVHWKIQGGEGGVLKIQYIGRIAKKRGTWAVCWFKGRTCQERAGVFFTGNWYPYAHNVGPDKTWHDKFILLRTLKRQVKIYTIYICDTQSAQKYDGHFDTCMWCTWSFFIVNKKPIAKFFCICICIIYTYILPTSNM